jgi:hypothetical protein
MAIPRWCDQVLTGEEHDHVLLAIKQNRSWLVTPWHDLELVHAVQQPLGKPVWQELQVTFRDKLPDDKLSAHLFGAVALHGPSTEKLDLFAAWTETIDDPAQPGPETRPGDAHVFELPLHIAAQGRTDLDSRAIPYSLRDQKLLTFSTLHAGQDKVPRPHMFGDTRYRRIAYRAVATTVFRENFRNDAELTLTSEPWNVDIKSRAPPATPKVLYVVPTQGWELTAGDHGTVQRRRRGGGLRIYLDRPWFSSGDGELLGVVVGSHTIPLADDYPFITLVGQDPIRAAAPLQFAKPTTFRNSARSTQLHQFEPPNKLMTIVLYTPVYDSETRRWYCDLELATENAYMPFVRLALTRYQPNAVEGMELSRIVLADVVQTLPDRLLTVVWGGEDVQITVAGVTYSAICGAASPRGDEPALARFVARLAGC